MRIRRITKSFTCVSFNASNRVTGTVLHFGGWLFFVIVGSASLGRVNQLYWFNDLFLRRYTGVCNARWNREIKTYIRNMCNFI